MEITTLLTRDAGRAGATLASAFADDPAFNWGLGNEGGNEQRLTPFFTSMVRTELRRPDHPATKAGNAEGVCMWRDIDDRKTPPSPLLRAVPSIVRTFRPMLERCDEEGVPAYLESSGPLNIPFYARHEFEVSGRFDLPDDWPEFTPMWREPR